MPTTDMGTTQAELLAWMLDHLQGKLASSKGSVTLSSKLLRQWVARVQEWRDEGPPLPLEEPRQGCDDCARQARIAQGFDVLNYYLATHHVGGR